METTQTATAEDLEPSFKLSTAQRNRLFMSLLVSFLVLNTAYASIGGVFLPAQLAKIDAAAKVNNLAAVSSIAAFFTLFVQPIVGTLSDRTRSRFGRRTPWIAGGAVAGGAAAILMQFSGTVVFVGIGWVVAQAALNVFQSPTSTLIADRVDYDHRAFGSSFVGVGTTLGISAGFALAGNMLNHMGVGYTVFGSAVIVWALVFVFINRDRSTAGLQLPPFSWKEFFLGFVRPLNFRKHPDFVWAWLGRFFMVLGYQAIQQYGLYIFTDYIGLAEVPAGKALANMNIVIMITTMIASLIFGRLSDKLGRRKMFVFGASAIMVVAIAVPLIAPSTLAMYIYGIIVGVGYGAYISVDLALMIDVLPSSGDSGKDLGVLNVASNIPQTLVPILAALLLGMFNHNYAVIFIYAIIGVILSSVCVFPIKSVK